LVGLSKRRLEGQSLSRHGFFSHKIREATSDFLSSLQADEFGKLYISKGIRNVDRAITLPNQEIQQPLVEGNPGSNDEAAVWIKYGTPQTPPGLYKLCGQDPHALVHPPLNSSYVVADF
jgi:hypothetical protein